jgi:hypothetical protein
MRRGEAYFKRIILLLAVGSDYNLLLVSRFKEELGAGLNTGIIRRPDDAGGSPRPVSGGGIFLPCSAFKTRCCLARPEV